MAYCAPWFSVQSMWWNLYFDGVSKDLLLFSHFISQHLCLNNGLVFMYHPFIVTPCTLYIRILYIEEQWAVSFPFRLMVLVITGLQTQSQRSGCFICQAQTENLRNLYLDFRAFTVMNEFIFLLRGDSNVKNWRLTVSSWPSHKFHFKILTH